MASEDIADILKVVESDMHLYELLHDKIRAYIKRDPNLKNLVHSFKSRFKKIDHLKEKILRKNKEDLERPEKDRKGPITTENIKNRITDICGIRILHLYMGQFQKIHKTIMNYVDSKEIALFEKPKAYTWDPEYSSYFQSLGLDSKLKESFYTSVHYVIKPRADSDITCEVQIRTLFEEVWGKIDHTFNYPSRSDSFAVQEQLKVLARMVGAGTRLADSIFKLSENEEKQKKV